MPLFMSEEELRLLAPDAAAVAERADAVIRDLRRQVDTLRAEADAASITAEQSCSFLEQRFAALSEDLERLQFENAQLASASEQHLSELVEAQAEKHQLHLKAIGKDGEIERITMEVVELRKTKRQALELIEQRDAEIREKNLTIQSYHDKIVNLTDNAVAKEAKLLELKDEIRHCQDTCNRITQEKELLEKHNTMLEEELNAKVWSLAEMRKSNMDTVAQFSTKTADLEREKSETSNSLKRSEEKVLELERRVSYLEKELSAAKEVAATNEQRFGVELSTVTKLADLHKQSSEEWSRKAGELEGVIKALEAHMAQVEDEHKEKLEKETSVRLELEKEVAGMKQQIEKYQLEIENSRKANELSLLPITGFGANLNVKELLVVDTETNKADENEQMIVPRIPPGVSATALAASLLRDGWSLAKIYEKYQETADALRHEMWGRRHAESILERVLHEIEEKAELILDERAEHERMVEAYSMMNQKLQQALLEHENFENTIRNLKAESKRSEREYNIAQKEINDLQKQVVLLLKECQDIQLRCGTSPTNYGYGFHSTSSLDVEDGSDPGKSSKHMNFKDINTLIEQNSQLRRQVHSLTAEVEKRDAELREGFQLELRNVSNEATSKVEAVLKRSEEQGNMIKSLHSSVAMYKRLYEEERKIRTASHSFTVAVPEDGKKDLMLLFEGSQEVSKKAYEQLAERSRNLEQDLTTLRSELTTLRTERDKMSLEADFARERLNSFMKELEHQRMEASAISARNVEMTHLVVDFQKRLRESSDSQQSIEENSRKLSVEMSLLKQEKEMLAKSEKRAMDEVRNLSERVHRLQSSLDTLQSTEEVRENARAIERRNQEEYTRRVERDWAEAKKELQEERDRVRALMFDKEKTVETSMQQVAELRKELVDALHAVASAESRAAVSEAKCADLEGRFNRRKIAKDGGGDHSALHPHEVNGELLKMKEEMEKLREEALANKNYMLQYKEIAHSSEMALKHLESVHQEWKAEAESLRKSLEDEISSLKLELSDLEKKYVLKCEEADSTIEAKEKELFSVMSEISVIRDDVSQKVAKIEMLEIQLSSLKDDLDQEHRRWQTAKDKYERQVILQSETIQELTSTSKELSVLQCEIAKLREMADAQKAENEALKALWEHEKLELQKERDEAHRSYGEINEQNKILHNRLEDLHIRLADKENSFAGYSSLRADSQMESDLRNVIISVRRSKEIAETEINLLKLEKLRLKDELECALKASDAAQASLRSQTENAKMTMLKNEEFKSLQLQVREINLLRESNIQLREENKHNFEECQKLRDEAQKAKLEAERLRNLLLAKELDIEACRKDMEMEKIMIENLNNRITELVESSKNIDPKDYEHVKTELERTKNLLSKNEIDLELSKKVVAELEHNIASCHSELAESENRLNGALQAEANIKMEITNIKMENEKQKKSLLFSKKKIEALMKEKEELYKENQALLKQIEDLKSSRKTMAETSVDQSTKEKDTRIQILERTLERERDDLRKERDDNRKEKMKRMKTEKTIIDLIQTVNKDKKKVEDEIAKYKQAIVVVLERTGIINSQLPSGSSLDEQTVSYFLSADNFEETANTMLNDLLGSQPTPSESPSVDTSVSPAGRQATQPQPKPPLPSQGKAVESVSGEARKAVRRLVRPALERVEETHDLETSAADAPTSTEEGKISSSHVPESSGVISSSHLLSSSRKRSALLSELRKETQGEDGSEAAPRKKPKETDAPHDSNELKSPSISPENPAATPEPGAPSADNINIQAAPEEMDAEQAAVLPDEEIVEAEREEDVVIEEEMEHKEDEEHEEDEHKEGQKEYVSEKLLDDSLTSEDVKEMVQNLAADGGDEREEGELTAEEPEQHRQDDIVSDPRHEPAGDETGEATLEAASPEPFSDKTKSMDIVEEVGEGVASELDQSLQITSGVSDGAQSIPVQMPSHGREGSSPSASVASSSAEQPRSPSSVAESEEPQSGRTTTTTPERARPTPSSRIVRFAPSRGPGRGPGAYRRDGARGSRGRGGGRGQL